MVRVTKGPTGGRDRPRCGEGKGRAGDPRGEGSPLFSLGSAGPRLLKNLSGGHKVRQVDCLSGLRQFDLLCDVRVVKLYGLLPLTLVEQLGDPLRVGGAFRPSEVTSFLCRLLRVVRAVHSFGQRSAGWRPSRMAMWSAA
jgi:hypothetical protein